jgi:TrkA-C domain
LPQRRGQRAPDRQFAIEDYASEVLVSDGSPIVGRTIVDEDLGVGELTVTALVREQGRRYVPDEHWKLFGGDVLVLRADPTAHGPSGLAVAYDRGRARFADHDAGHAISASCGDGADVWPRLPQPLPPRFTVPPIRS